MIFKSMIDEIASDKSLKIYGGILALTHLVTWYFWFQGMGYQNIMSDPSYICWSFMDQCHWYRKLPLLYWDLISIFYLLVTLVTVKFFFFSKNIKVAYFLFLFLTLFKFILLLGDYRFMGNYHYMPFIVSVVYLIIPQKKVSIMYTVVMFYISAGLLKLDTEWLSGSALLENFFVGGEILEWLLAYTIIFEIMIVPLTLASSFWLFVFSFPQIIGFHALSWHIVGYFYPCIMFLVLSCFLLFRIDWKDKKLKVKPIPSLNARSLLFLSLLGSAQILPRILSPDLAINSQGRLFTLNMLDARVQCEHFSYYNSEEGVYVETSSERTDLGTRIACDPLVYSWEARHICSNKEESEVPLFLVAKKSTHNRWHQIFKDKNYCESQKGVSWWGGL